MATVTIKHVTKAFGDNVVLKEFNETFQEGEFITLLGPSGCGTAGDRCLRIMRHSRENKKEEPI